MSFALRWVGLLAIWMILTDGRMAHLGAGVVASAVAAGVSLWLWPSPVGARNLLAWPLFGVRLLIGSFTAGLDIARRAFSRDPGLKPGFVRYRPQLPPGPARNAFRALMSLQPGSLPIEATDGDGWLVHCLDVTAPVATALAEEEARFMNLLASRETS